VKRFLLVLACIGFGLLVIWGSLFLYFVFLPLGPIFAIGSILAVFRYKRPSWFIAAFVLVALAYAFYPARADRDWRVDQAVTAESTIEGDTLRIKNIRNFRYRTVDNSTPAYYDAEFDLRELESLWYIVEPFSTWQGAAHTFVTFGFKGDRYFGVSIELRKEKGEDFSAIRGAFKQYELVYIVGDERDLIGLRLNARKHDVYLYPIRATADERRKLLVDMLNRSNALAKEPEYYHTLASSCTTNIVGHINRIWPGRVPFSFKTLFPGYADELAYELGLIDTALPFEEARGRHRIAAEKVAESADFSSRIRSINK